MPCFSLANPLLVPLCLYVWYVYTLQISCVLRCILPILLSMAEVGDYKQLNGRDQAVKVHETLQKQKGTLKRNLLGVVSICQNWPPHQSSHKWNNISVLPN